MRKALLIMAAALMTMTQCRKQETSPVTPATDTIRMTITAGPGAKTDINTETGGITWSAGDKLYVSKNGSWLGCLDLVSGEGTPHGTFTGSVTGLDDEGAPCHFFYLGRDNGMAEPTGTAAANISLASQDGTLAGAMKYHAGYGRTDVTVKSGEYQGYVVMNTKIAIAHINFTTDGTQAYTGSVTMGGTGISNTLSVTPAGIFSGSGDGGIAIDKGDGTSGERYVTLIPTGTTDVLNVAFTGDATGGMTFANGIVENKFYGMKDAVKVTVTPKPKPKFSVGKNDQGQLITVEFAPGNLWYGKADGAETAEFHFETNQWETQPASTGQWVTDHKSHLKWSDAAHAVTSDQTVSGNLFCASDFEVDGEGDWRTLSKDEWEYLINKRTVNGGTGDGKSYKRATVNGVYGMILYPDSYTAQSSSTSYSGDTWTSMEEAGVVFLPAAGYRSGTDVKNVGTHGYYWSSTPNSGAAGQASFTNFTSDNVNPQGNQYCRNGYSVRLVR
ncbi:MAG: DUF1566 domain-containing protein [Bacteroidales bacterium]|nr:DUF1566 domain-containing protein [Bacteroidales bacterium]